MNFGVSTILSDGFAMCAITGAGEAFSDERRTIICQSAHRANMQNLAHNLAAGAVGTARRNVAACIGKVDVPMDMRDLLTGDLGESLKQLEDRGVLKSMESQLGSLDNGWRTPAEAIGWFTDHPPLDGFVVGAYAERDGSIGPIGYQLPASDLSSDKFKVAFEGDLDAPEGDIINALKLAQTGSDFYSSLPMLGRYLSPGAPQQTIDYFIVQASPAEHILVEGKFTLVPPGRDQLLERLAQLPDQLDRLEMLLADFEELRSQARTPPQMGHNGPPEDVETYLAQHRLDLTQAIQIVRDELRKPAPEDNADEEKLDWARRFMLGLSFIARNAAQGMLRQFGQRIAEKIPMLMDLAEWIGETISHWLINLMM